ncbi:MAG: hypothetical protein ACM3S1_08760, partial [Hyphomicrobiales bacterium]
QGMETGEYLRNLRPGAWVCSPTGRHLGRVESIGDGYFVIRDPDNRTCRVDLGQVYASVGDDIVVEFEHFEAQLIP